jgi:hypothetical protein
MPADGISLPPKRDFGTSRWGGSKISLHRLYWSAQTGLANPIVQAIRKMSEQDISALQTNLREQLPTNRSGRIAYPARANAVKGRVPN